MAWYAIVLAGGSGSRMGAACNKVLLSLDGEPILCRSVEAFRGLVEGIVLVTRPEEMTACRSLMSSWGLAGSFVPMLPGAWTGRLPCATVWRRSRSNAIRCWFMMPHGRWSLRR